MSAVLHIWRELRRAPLRILTSVFALALAVGAIGVFAIPTVSTSSLRDTAERDGVPQIVLETEATGGLDVTTAFSGIDNVDRVEPGLWVPVELDGIGREGVVGLDIGSQEMNLLGLVAGRLPTATGEVVASTGTAGLGDVFTARAPDGSALELSVVGVGATTLWGDDDVFYASLDTASFVSGVSGANLVVVRTFDRGKDALRTTAGDVREVLAANDIALVDLPLRIPNQRHPIEADIEQISSLIGYLGIAAGFVALVLLGSTANTLITERSREVAVMRALGATDRAMRRRLRRIALGIAAAAVVIGVPLGVWISNFIARMVLDEFVGLTPGFAVSIPVMAASAVFALVGARLVAANAARRVTKRPLAEALRDRAGAPFGQRLLERLSARLPIGSLLDRTAVRNGVHQRARSLAMFAQIGAAVAALMIIASLATTVNSFNASEYASARWQSSAFVPGPGLDIDASIADGRSDIEVGADIGGELKGWEIGVTGLRPDTQMIDTSTTAGRWFSQPGEMVVARGFAKQTGIEVGDDVMLELAAGEISYTVVGLHADRDRSVFVDFEQLGNELGQPGRGDVVWSINSTPPAIFEDISDEVVIERLADLDTDDAGRNAIVAIFGAVGAIVVSVAGLAVASGLAVNLYERRAQFAALQALGGRRRDVFRVVVAELLPLAAAGIVGGLIVGYLGARAIIGSFEAANAVEIGFEFATGAIPAASLVVVVGALFIGAVMVRQVTRRPAAITLRGAA